MLKWDIERQLDKNMDNGKPISTHKEKDLMGFVNASFNLEQLFFGWQIKTPLWFYLLLNISTLSLLMKVIKIKEMRGLNWIDI